MATLVTRDPKFGWDPWIGPGIPLDLSDSAVWAQPLYSGADTLAGDINLLPNGLDAYMSYVDNFGGWGELVQRFDPPGTKNSPLLVSITIFGNAARCADVEPGAMRAGDLPHWLDNVALKTGGIPWVYTSASAWTGQGVNAAIGGRKVIRWSAHYGFGPHICGPSTCGYPQADWTQWADTGPLRQNFDRSIGKVLPQPPAPADPHHYQWFPNMGFLLGGQRLNERATVRAYDRLRATQRPSKAQLAQLVVLRAGLGLLAGRVWTVAHMQKQQGYPSWSLYHRGWRYQQLIHRAQGKRIV